MPIASQAEVSVRVVSQTGDGQWLDFDYAFTAEHRTAPRMLATDASKAKMVRLGLAELSHDGGP